MRSIITTPQSTAVKKYRSVSMAVGSCFYCVDVDNLSRTEYRVWVLEHRVQQQYTAYLSILNWNFSADLSSHSNLAFKKEAKGVQNLVSRDHEFL